MGSIASDVKVLTATDCNPKLGPCTDSYTKDSVNVSDILYGAGV